MNFEPITYNDLAAIRNLQPEDWPDIIPDIEMYIRSPFCFPIKTYINHKIAGIGASIIFKNTGWLAHIIVHEDLRNLGIGYAIVNELLKNMKKAGVYTYLLIATELGQPVYQKAGFSNVTEYVYLKREIPWNDKPVSNFIIPFREEFRSFIYELDKYISGENRVELLVDHIENSMVFYRNNKVEGFYLPGLKEGLIYAENKNAGLELMNLKYSTADRVALPAENKAGVSFLKENCFTETNSKGTRMIFGEALSWHPELVFSRIGGNLG